MSMTPMAVEVRKRCGTIRAFAQALGVSASKAGMICQGRYLACMTSDELRQIAHALDMPTQEALQLLAESYHQWSGQDPYPVCGVTVSKEHGEETTQP